MFNTNNPDTLGDDEALILLSKQKDKEAFTIIYQKYHQYLYACFMTLAAATHFSAFIVAGAAGIVQMGNAVRCRDAAGRLRWQALHDVLEVGMRLVPI